MPGVKLDSLSYNFPLNELNFACFELNAKMPNDFQFHSISLSRLFGMKELTLNVSFVDEALGYKMIDAFNASTFEVKK